MRDVLLATGNSAKAELFRSLMPADVRLRVADPGDAEEVAGGSYEQRASAKAHAILDSSDAQALVFGHDSGFEFECLGWKPGVHSKQWLATHREMLRAVIVPGSRVRVVHCVVAVLGGHARTMLFDDLRKARLPAEQGGAHRQERLPLGEWTEGPREALQRCVWETVRMMDCGRLDA